VTLKEIAEVTQVSIATVSYALNGKGTIGRGLAERIKIVAKEMGYSPCNFGRGLRTGRSRTMAFVLPDLTNPFFTAVAQSAQHTANELGYAMLLFDSRNDSDVEQQAFQVLTGFGIDGAIWISTRTSLTANVNFPIVAIDRPHPDYDGVHVDHYNGGELIAKHAIAMGHRRVGLLSGPQGQESARLRREGFTSAAGDQLDFAWEIEVHFDRNLPELAREAIRRNDVSFIFAANDMIAHGAIEVIEQAGWRVPEDISVVGFDDIPWATLQPTSLTTVAQPFTALGEQAVRMLEARINDPNREVTHTVLPARLIVRNSSPAYPMTHDPE